MRILEISDETKAICKALVERAQARPTTYEQVVEMSKDAAAADKFNDDNDELTVTIPRGYVICYTEEYQRPDVRCRHLSVSVLRGKPDTGPNPVAVMEIMKMIGFANHLGRCAVYVGKLPDRRLCINIIEPVSGNMGDLQ